MRYTAFFILLLFSGWVNGQKPKSEASRPFSLMPFNRMIQSAGKVITFGDPQLENHALDVVPLPGGQQLVVEDRYGIAIVSADNGRISHRWTLCKR